MLIVPNTDPEDFCADYGDWQPQIENHQLIVDTKKLRLRANGRDMQGFPKWKAELLERLKSRKVQRWAPIDVDKAETIAFLETPAVVPTYVYSWDDFRKVLGTICKEHGIPRHADALDTLYDFACCTDNDAP